MPTKKLDIKVINGDEPHSKIYILSQPIKGFSTYERAKAIHNFVEKETKVLEIAIENDLREFLKKHDISIEDGSNEALSRACAELECKGFHIGIRDRYYQIGDERIIGESPNQMTVIEEEGILSAAMEVVIDEREHTTT